MVRTLKELLVFITKKERLWLLPIVLLLIIIGLLLMAVQLSPVSIFLYPLI